MPIESPQYFIILFRVNKVFNFYHIIVKHEFIKQFMIIESHCRYLTEFYFTDSTRYGIIFFKIMNLV